MCPGRITWPCHQATEPLAAGESIGEMAWFAKNCDYPGPATRRAIGSVILWASAPLALRKRGNGNAPLSPAMLWCGRLEV